MPLRRRGTARHNSRMKKRHALITAAALLAAAAVLAAPPPSGDPRLDHAIETANSEWAAAMKSGDVAAIARPYLDDALFVGPDGACTRGRAAIEALYVERFRKNARASATRIEPRSVVRDGDLAYESGYGEMTFIREGKPVTAGGRYLAVWARQPDGGWKILRNVVLP